MSAITTNSLVNRHPVPVDEFEKMISAGVFRPGSRLELIRGEIVTMSPIDKDHAYIVDDLDTHFSALRPLVRLRVQGPLRLSDDSRPEPDLLLLKPHAHGYRRRLPHPADVLLAIEVADSSFRVDYHVKRPEYALHGIRELWIVEIPGKRIHICRKPREGVYQSEFITTGDDRISPLTFPDHQLVVGRLF